MSPPMEAEMEVLNEDDDDGRGGELEFTANDIDGMDANAGSFSYWNEEKKARLILTKDGAMTSQPNGFLLQKLSQLRATGSKSQEE